MENEINKLQWAKMFMDYLANGVDPVSNTDADAETLHNEEIRSCFRYISEILARDIYETESNIRKGNVFYITDEQFAELKTYSYNCKVSELAIEINRVTVENNTKKFSATWINDWLESEGYLCKSDLRSRITTDKGKQLGITSEYRKRDNGNEYYINFFTEQAQRFIYDHIRAIIAYRHEQYSQIAEQIQSVDYPHELSVREFIRQNSDKCFILSIGSCDSVSKVGSYIAVLMYKGRSKVLRKTNIPTNSANKCILTGIIDAASAIKLPTDVIILSSTPLGFHTPKSKNYRFCQEIYRILTEKECSIAESVCQGKGYELNSFVKSLAG
ncbi:MAG: hypothetical protein K6B38_07850 [Ruminococcus sp.]|nr:hypothetical protein [Ruminococcus sp.]